MTFAEWLIFGTVVGLLWLPFAIYMLTPPRKVKVHVPSSSVFNEIARWQEASERTYARQGIKR